MTHPTSTLPASVVIRPATRDDISALAAVHTQGMPNDFLVRLGRTFLTKVLYPTLLRSPRSRIYVANLHDGARSCNGTEPRAEWNPDLSGAHAVNRPETCRMIGHGHIDAEIAGFIVTRVGVGGVLSETMTSHPIWFLAALASAIIRRPALLWASFSVIAQLWSRTGQPDDPTVVELFLMAVHADARRRGVGTALVRHSAARLREAEVTAYRVRLHAHNEAADRFYESAGFAQRKSYSFAGRQWREREMKLA